VWVAGTSDTGDARPKLFVRELGGGKWRDLRPVFDDEDLEHRLDESTEQPRLLAAPRGAMVLAFLLGNSVYVMRRAGASWTELSAEDEDPFSPGADDAAVALDRAGVPVVFDDRVNGTMRIQRWSGKRWEELPEPFVEIKHDPARPGTTAIHRVGEHGRTMQPAIAVDGAGRVLLAYTEGFQKSIDDPPQFAVHVLRQHGAGWEDLGLPLAVTEDAARLSPSLLASPAGPIVLLVHREHRGSADWTGGMPWESMSAQATVSIEVHRRAARWTPTTTVTGTKSLSPPPAVLLGNRLCFAFRTQTDTERGTAGDAPSIVIRCIPTATPAHNHR
jgi:hypothetical protein